MNRRHFIWISSAAILPVLLKITSISKIVPPHFDIQVDSDRKTGHLLKGAQTLKSINSENIDVMIVGGGIAGVTAAYKTRKENMLLFELSEMLGGTSSYNIYKDVKFGQGAHYDLAYPKYFGKDVIALLKEIDVIQWNQKNGLYEFIDKQHVIPSNKQELCYQNDTIREDVLGGSKELDLFYKILQPFENKMPLPSRIIDEKYHYLNDISFYDFLKNKINISNELNRRISYQMLDDWGGTTKMISALAGIHYYTCRPYNNKNIELFSPPEGNYYFVQKMVKHIPYEKIKVNSLVSKITTLPDKTFVAEVINTKQNTIQEIKAKNIIYTGKKHALKFVHPESYELFNKNQYAPWIVINIVVEKGIVNLPKWQNDMIVNNETFLGLVNSTIIPDEYSSYDVITAYFCFSPEDRNMLIDLEEKPSILVDETIKYIELLTQKNIYNSIQKVYVKIMGHAMPIPYPGYLNFDSVDNGNLKFAGVDTGKLPLFFEAVDSGISATNNILPVKHES